MKFSKVIYPAHNNNPFEHYFHNRFIKENPDVNYQYLPVMWTGYYVNNCFYGKKQDEVDKLQVFIDSFENIPSFIILQYSGGILNDLSKFDKLIVFNMGGMGIEHKNCINIPIPLMTSVESKKYDFQRSFYASFIGRLDTHICRRWMADILGSYSKYYISEDFKDYNDYCEQLAKSVFSLCPRGFGKTSFRIYEAMQCESIPVYISDEYWEPYNIPFNEYGIKIDIKDIVYIPEILRNKYYEIGLLERLKSKIRDLNKTLFNYNSCYNWIIDKLCQL